MTKQECRGCTERLTPAVISFPAGEQWLKNKCSPSAFPPRCPHALAFPGLSEWKAGILEGAGSLPPCSPELAEIRGPAALTGTLSLPSQARPSVSSRESH